ncbi:MAG: hypothetical protein OSB02_11655 [Rhodospirillaceae bacterium]|nr:hypothetical protein [Rhodospirillaceae bacterium]
MAFNFDIFGLGSKRKWAFQVLDREWSALDVDIRRIDGGVRQLLYRWAQESGESKQALDQTLISIAKFSGYLMLGPELGARPFGQNGLTEMSALFDTALKADSSLEGHGGLHLEVRIVRLILAAGLADRDIESIVELETDPD